MKNSDFVDMPCKKQDGSDVPPSLTSYPDIFYLCPDSESSRSFQNVELISSQGSRLQSHQALLGAACHVLKTCLLEPRLLAETEAVLIFPEYSLQDLEAFLNILYGSGSAKEASESVKELLKNCGFITDKVKPARSIAHIKSETVSYTHLTLPTTPYV